MSLPKDDAAVLSARWIEDVLLKRDVFSILERGRFRKPGGEVDAVLRRIDQVPWWSYLPARRLFAHERRALALAMRRRREFRRHPSRLARAHTSSDNGVGVAQG
jgi:hypothetical protein